MKAVASSTLPDRYTSILKPSSISEAGMPPRNPQFSGGTSMSVILISSGGTSSARKTSLFQSA
jgi:hypothetical protein